MFAALYGAEYLGERTSRIEHLRQMHLIYPQKYPLGFVKNTWGTLNARWRQDFRAVEDTLRLYAKAERPTPQQLQAVGMTVVSATGMTLFRRPDTFDMTRPTSYFVSEIIRKLNDDKELQDRTYYHSPSQRHSSRISGPPLEGPAEEFTALSGPNLTPAERRVGGANAPTNATGEKLCWDFNAHLGCSDHI